MYGMYILLCLVVLQVEELLWGHQLSLDTNTDRIGHAWRMRKISMSLHGITAASNFENKSMKASLMCCDDAR